MAKKKSPKKSKTRRKRNFNVHHPELRKGEVFVTNSFFPAYGWIGSNGEDDHVRVGRILKSMRIGSVAYDTSGRRITEGAVPIFAKRKEYLTKKHRLWPKMDLI